MKNPVIFVLSISQSFREPQQLAPNKAGFFYVSANSGLSVLISSGPSLPNPKKGNWPAEVDLLTAVFGGPLFLSAYLTSTSPHYAHRNHTARTAANTTHTFSAPPTHPKQDGPATCSHGSRVSPANGAPETTNRNDGAGQLPASITFAAIPPAAFFHTTFFNLACSGEGRIA